MTTQLRFEPISTVLTRASNAEDVLEACGIDYWFDGDRTLSAACAAANVDVGDVEQKLTPCADDGASSVETSVATLVRELDSHFDATIRPAMARVREALREVPAEARPALTRTVNHLDAVLASHAELLSSYVLPAIAPRGEIRSNYAVVRQLAQQHALLAIRVRNLTDACPAGNEAFACAARELAHAIHHHLRISYAGVMPHLFEHAVKARGRPERI